MHLIVPFARRLLMAAGVLLAASVVLFAAVRVPPGGPVAVQIVPADEGLPTAPVGLPIPMAPFGAEITRQPLATPWEVEEAPRQVVSEPSVPAQYASWLGQVLSGELGWSVHRDRPVTRLVAEALPATVELVLLAMAVAGVLGVLGGVVLFVVRAEGVGGEAGEALAESGTALLMSVPEFLWALLFILVFGVVLEALPFTGRLDADLARPLVTGLLVLDTVLVGDGAAFMSAMRHMALPALALGVAAALPVMRVLCASLGAVYRSDYIRQARLRGLSETRVLLGHALRNAALPTLPVVGLQFGFLLGGSLLVEVIFAYPGIGSLMAEAVRDGDLPVIQAVGLAYCLLVVVANAVVGGVHLWLSPRAVAG